MGFSTIEEAISDLQRGRHIIIVDDENRENEGDLVIAAEKATPSKINFMIKKAGGLVCVPMLGERLDELGIPLMVQERKNTEITKCKFTVSVDINNGTTGISAFDRSDTIKTLIDPATKPDNLSRPGHIFPLRYTEGGVQVRPGHTESSVDMCNLAGLYPAAVICEILNEDGTTAKLPEIFEYAKKHRFKVISIEEIINFLKRNP